MPLCPPTLSRQLKLLLLSSFVAFQAGAATLPDGVSEASSIEGVTEYRLANGLRVLLAPDQSKPTTTVNMTYLVGSRNENYGQTGMAHLLEHMMFKGTKNMRNALGEFSKRGLQANGSTSDDRTNYFASFASNTDTLDWYLGWQADAMVNSTILRSDLDSEMTVVRNEMESGENSPFRILLQKMEAAAFQWHSYGKNTIGARSDVENVDIGQLRAFYHEYYQPDNAVLIVAGKFDTDNALKTIADTLGKIPRPDRKLPREYTVEPVQDGERSVTLRRAGGTPLVGALYHAPAAGSSDYIPLDLATDMLSATPSGQLYKAMVPRKLASSVFGFSMEHLDPGLIMFGAELEPGMNVDNAMKAMTSAVESPTRKPFTDEELERARRQWLLGWDRIYNDPQRLGVALSEAIASGDWRLFFLQRDRVRAAKLADVQRVASSYLVSSNRTEGRYIPTANPERAPLQTRVDLTDVLKNYKGDPKFAQASAFDSSPANIDKLTQRSKLDLPNGTVQLALLPKPTRGNRVVANLLFQFGNVQTLRGQRAVAEAVADLLDHGTAKLSRQQIQDAFDGLKANVSFGGAGTDLVVRISTTGDNLPDAIALVLDIVRNASFPADQLAEYRTQAITAIRGAMAEPTAEASRALARHGNVYPVDDIRYVPTFEESIAGVNGLTREALKRFHDRFYGAGNISFAAVGEFEPAAVQAALKKGLAGWKRGAPYTRVPDPYHAIKADKFEIETPDKANAFFVSAMPLKLQDTNPDYPALVLANFMLGSSETSRLWERVRQQEGISYNVRSSLSASSYEPDGTWQVYAIFAPQNRDRLEQAVNQELARLLKDGYTDAEVKDAATALLNFRRIARAQDGTVASTWLDYLQTHRTFEWSADMDRKLAALTADSVNAALRKYLQPDQFSTAIAGDFKKVQQSKAVPPKPSTAPTPQDQPPAQAAPFGPGPSGAAAPAATPQRPVAPAAPAAPAAPGQTPATPTPSSAAPGQEPAASPTAPAQRQQPAPADTAPVTK